MYTGGLVFSQIMDFMPLPIFRRCVAKSKSDIKLHDINILDILPLEAGAFCLQQNNYFFCNSSKN